MTAGGRAGFGDASALLKHECAYCLGQMQDVRAIPALTAVLRDEAQDTMVRHEAGEALGALGTPECKAILLVRTGPGRSGAGGRVGPGPATSGVF